VLTNNSPKAELLTPFPTTRYQGSKRRLIPWIYENIQTLEFNTVLDLFGGTGSVSYLLKKMNKTVTYNDYLKFNHYIGLSLIENRDTLLTESDISWILNDQNPDVPYTSRVMN